MTIKIKHLCIAVAMASHSVSHATEENTFSDVSLEYLLNFEITAQKRVEKLVDVPIAVSALKEQQIDALHASNIEELQHGITSLSFRKGTTALNSTLTVRGIGTVSFSAAAEPSVSTVLDGVVLGRSGQAFQDLYDIERIEVLRGPQGTLFGKNASAGVVNIATKNPTDKFSGRLLADWYNDGGKKIVLRASGPLSSQAQGSLTLLESQFNGNIHNVYNQSNINGFDRQGLRGKLYLGDLDAAHAKFIVESYTADDSCCADLELLLSGRNNTSPAAPNNTGADNKTVDFDHRQVDHDFATKTNEQSDSFSFEINRPIGTHDLTSISAYREWRNDEFREGDFTSIAGKDKGQTANPPLQMHDIGHQTWWQTSQEIRLTSPADSSFSYQIGLFFWDMRSESDFTRDASCQKNAGNDSILAANPGVTCNTNDIVSATAFMSTEFKNQALFIDGKYKLNDSNNILYGVRYTHDTVNYTHKRVNLDSYGRAGLGVRPALGDTDYLGDVSENNVSGKIGFQHYFNPNTQLYVTAARGYKGPGFNVFYNMGINDTAPIGPEESEAFELGFKMSNDNVLLGATAFHTFFSGFQANNFDTRSGATITRLTNAGDVVTSGFELDATWLATSNFSLIASLAAVKAEVDAFKCPVGQACSTRSGSDIPFSPDEKMSLTANYLQKRNRFDMTYMLSLSHTGDQVSDLPSNDGTLNPAANLPAYSLVNGTITLDMKDTPYAVSFIVKNLLDEKFVTTYSGDGFRYQVPRNADRYVGLSFDIKI